jgi:hypothetical protein
MKNKWKYIEVGDFFTADIKLSKDSFLYQRIDETKSGGFNAVLLNTGELCYLYINPNEENQFSKVQVEFATRLIN